VPVEALLRKIEWAASSATECRSVPRSNIAYFMLSLLASCRPEVLPRFQHIPRNSAGERSPVRWYEFEGEWAWGPTDIGIGKLSVHGMKQVWLLVDVLSYWCIPRMSAEISPAQYNETPAGDVSI
jgi:hypothetical protein